MESAFWDSSSLVPLCVAQPSSLTVRQLSSQYRAVVWWAAPVEVRSAFARLARMGLLPPTDFAMAQAVLRVLRNNWREVLPTFQIREEAENLIDRFQLRAADALQLAAALKWCQGPPRGHVFLSGDKQLLDAARMIGFHGIET